MLRLRWSRWPLKADADLDPETEAVCDFCGDLNPSAAADLGGDTDGWAYCYSSGAPDADAYYDPE